MPVINGKGISVEGSGGGGESTVSVAEASVTPSSTSASISFSGLSGEPTSFVLIAENNLSTGASPYKTACVVDDGDIVIGQYICNTSNAQMHYDASGFTKTYSNGTLTVTGSGSSFMSGISYRLIYSYGNTPADIKTVNVQVSSDVTSISFNVDAEPKYFSCIFKTNIGTASGYARANAIAGYDGTVRGLYMGSNDTASASAWTTRYSDGVFTISSSSSSTGGYFHQPGYYQLTYVVDTGGTSGDYDLVLSLQSTPDEMFTGYSASVISGSHDALFNKTNDSAPFTKPRVLIVSSLYYYDMLYRMNIEPESVSVCEYRGDKKWDISFSNPSSYNESIQLHYNGTTIAVRIFRFPNT